MNKKTLAIILSIALAVGAFAGLSFNLFLANATDYVGDGNELVTDGNASATVKVKLNGGASGFYSHGAGTGLAGTAYTGDVDGNGLAFLVPPRSDNATGNRVYFNNFTLEAGKYIFTCYVKAESAITIKLGFAAGSNKYPSDDTNPMVINVPANEWTKITYVTDEIAAGTYAIGFTSGDATSAVTNYYVDSISMQKAVVATPEPTTAPATTAPQATATPEPVGDGNELVTNGTCTVDEFVRVVGKPVIQGGTSFKGTSYANDADGNGVALGLTSRGSNPNENRAWVELMPLEAGQYVLSFYAKSGVNGKIGVWFGTGKYPTTAPNVKTEHAVSSTEWTKIVRVVTVDADGNYTFGISSSDAATAAAEFYIDNISFQKVGTPSGGNGNAGGNSNAGSSNTGDVLPVAMIAVAVISASALVIVARRKRED